MFEALRGQDAKSSKMIIDSLCGEEDFVRVSKFEGDSIVARDGEDALKLQAGIQVSIEQGVLPVLNPPPTYMKIDVIGKSPDDVCDIILKHMGSAAETGGVAVICGLSGTGKGTTVARLQERLPKGTGWSNGNVFRSLTLLAATWCEQEGVENVEDSLTSENVDNFMSMLTFGKFSDEWDIKIQGLGISALVSEVQNTLLKGPKVSKNIPTVASRSQGAVVKFAADATKKMGEDGLIVVLEGREATVNYIPSPFRYTLTMSDVDVLGQRRAAQRIAAEALASITSNENFNSDSPPDDQIVLAAIKAATSNILAEIQS